MCPPKLVDTSLLQRRVDINVCLLAPYVADVRDQARVLCVPGDVGHAESRQRQPQGRWPLACNRLDLNRELWGERPGDVPSVLSLRGQPIAA